MEILLILKLGIGGDSRLGMAHPGTVVSVGLGSTIGGSSVSSIPCSRVLDGICDFDNLVSDLRVVVEIGHR